MKPQMSRPLGALTALMLLALTLGLVQHVHAQRGMSVSEASRLLASNDADEIRMGIENLGLSGRASAVAPLSARIERGLPRPLLEAAVETLGVLAKPAAGPILFRLTDHRVPSVRVAALRAIVACRPRGADAALIEALGDLDPRVRGAAAIGLGELGARGSLDALFHAFDRGVIESVTSIGQLADAAATDRLLGYLERVPLDSINPGLNEIFARSDVSNAIKLRVVGRLGELATPEVRTYLSDLYAALPDPGGDLGRAIQDAVRRISE
jgi:HEAT repeat protein